MKHHHPGALTLLAAAVLFAAWTSPPLSAQVADADSAAPRRILDPGDPAELLILGTYHFANPGLDVLQFEVPDPLSPEKQREILRVVEAVAAFRPTKIAVESRPERSGELDSLYRAYRDDRHEPSRNEIQQIGFRLADRFGLDRLHPVDHPGEFPFEPLMEYAQQHDPDFVAWLERFSAQKTEETNRQHRELTVGEILRHMNDPEVLAADQAAYLGIARVGAGDSQVGADLLSSWYERNIRIHSNIQALTEPGARILLVIGAGHAPILRELARADPRIRLADSREHLPER